MFLQYKEQYTNEYVQAMMIMKSNDSLVLNEKRIRDENRILNETLKKQNSLIQKENELIKN